MKQKQKKNPFLSLQTAFNSNIAACIVIGIAVMMILFGVMAQLLGYVQFSAEFTQEYTENAFRIADAAESFVNADRLEVYLAEGGTSEDYTVTLDELNNLCNKVNARFIYVIKPDETFEHITFVFNAVNENSGFEAYDIGYVRTTTNDDYKVKYEKLYRNFSDKEFVVRDKGFIETESHITAMVPLKDWKNETVGILCVQRQMDALTTARRNYMIKMMVVIICLVVLATFVYNLFLDRYLIKPLRKINNETKRFAASPGKADSPLSDSIRSDNEIGQLAASVDKMESETLSYIDNLTKATAETQRIGTELAVASAIQQGMLTSVVPDTEALSINATMTPAKEVGGDFYDFFMIDDDHICMVIADVSGKGVPAAMFMTVTKVLINDSTMIHNSPAAILKTVNERICANNKLDMFVTVWIGILELSTGKVVASNAGHEYPAIGRKGIGFELLKDKHCFVVGGMSGVSYKDYEFKLDPGDALFLYTDGVAEATDRSEQLFGTDRMISALNIAPDLPPEELIANVKDAVDLFVADAPQFDDMTMMCIRYHGNKSENNN